MNTALPLVNSHLTLSPVRMDSEKAAPMERPSMKLWIPSPKMIIQATVAMLLADLTPSTVSTVGRVAGCGRSWRRKIFGGLQKIF